MKWWVLRMMMLVSQCVSVVAFRFVADIRDIQIWFLLCWPPDLPFSAIRQNVPLPNTLVKETFWTFLVPRGLILMFLLTPLTKKSVCMQEKCIYLKGRFPLNVLNTHFPLPPPSEQNFSFAHNMSCTAQCKANCIKCAVHEHAPQRVNPRDISNFFFWHYFSSRAVDLYFCYILNPFFVSH